MQRKKGFSPLLMIPIGILTIVLMIVAIFAISSWGNVGATTAAAIGRQPFSTLQQNPQAVQPSTQQSGGTPVTTTITLATSNQYLGTAINGVNMMYRLVSVSPLGVSPASPWTTTTSSGTISGSQGQTYEIAVAYNNATDYGIGTASATAGTITSNPDPTRATVLYTVPYLTTATITFQLAPVATVSSITYFVNNPDGGAANTNGTAYQPLAQTEKDMPFTISGVSNTAYGTLSAGLNSNIFVCLVNRTSITNLNLIYPQPNTQGQSVSLPTAFVPQDVYTGTNGTYAWYFPVLNGGAAYSFKLAVIPSTATANAPSAGANGEGANVNCELYDSGPYWDQTTGSNNVYYGVQDQNKNSTTVGAVARPQIKFAFARTSTGG